MFARVLFWRRTVSFEHERKNLPRRAHHHPHNARAFVREVSGRVRQRGLRLTEIRSQVLELIADSRKPVKAYDLLDRLKDARSNAAPPTVYRALDFLLDNGFIHKLQSINAYVSCHHPSVWASGAVFDLRRVRIGDRNLR